MKKTVFVVCLILLCSGLFAQTEYFQDMTNWQNVEREMHKIAEQFLQDRKKDPELKFRNTINEKTGLLIGVGCEERPDVYYVAAYLKASTVKDYSFPYMEALSLQIGATYMFELLYGKPGLFRPAEGVLQYRWMTRSWYELAVYHQEADTKEILILVFYGENFY